MQQGQEQVAKRCAVCGRDVSQQKRVKDQQGRYYCEGCSRQANIQTPTPAPSSQQVVQPKDCTNCGKAVGALQQLQTWQGHQVCLPCREMLQAEEEQRQRDEAERQQKEAAAAALAKQQEEQAQQQQVDAKNRRRQSLNSCVVVVILTLIICGTLLVFYVAAVQAGAPAAQTLGFCMVLAVLGGAAALWLCGRKYRRCLADTPDATFVGDLLPLLFGGVVGVAGLVAFIALVAFSGWIGYRLWGDTGATVCSMGLLLGGLIGIGTWFMAESDSRCPKCRLPWVAETLGTQRVDSHERVIEKSQKLYTLDRESRVLATTVVPTTEKRVTEVYATYKRCKKCGHEWTTTSKETRRG